MQIFSKTGLLKIFGTNLGFYSINSPRNSSSPHFMITCWNQKSRNAGTSCTSLFSQLISICFVLICIRCEINAFHMHLIIKCILMHLICIKLGFLAACISNFRSSSMCLWVISNSCFCSVFIGMLMLTRSFLFL